MNLKLNSRRGSLEFLKQNSSIKSLFQKMDSNPITTIQNPVFDFITEELLSSGYLHTHVFNDGINNTKELFFDLKNEE